jgi:hypothetical protein
MNKSQVIGGIVCLVLALGLGAVYYALPAEDLWYIGDNTIPFPPIILGIAGILLLVTAWRSNIQESE